MKAVQNDMTAGRPMKIIFDFTLPIFIGNVFQQFYNMADAVIVGKFVGTGALAAVGSTGTIMFLIYGFVVGMTAGFTRPDSAEIRSRGYVWHETYCGRSFYLVVDYRSNLDSCFYAVHEALAVGDEHAVRYICGCICIYHDH